MEFVPAKSCEIRSTVTRKVVETVEGWENIIAKSELRSIQNAAQDSKVVRQSIMSTVMNRLKKLRSISGIYHQAIAQALDIEDAKMIVTEWREHPENNGQFTIDFVGYERPQEENEAVLDQLRKGTIDIIVHVSKLGEGFDHPRLTVCCMFKRYFHQVKKKLCSLTNPLRYGSINPFAQFVGRTLRTISNKMYVMFYPIFCLVKTVASQ